MEPKPVIVDGYLIVEGQRFKLWPPCDEFRHVAEYAEMLAADARFQRVPLARPLNSRHLWASPGESGAAVLSRWAEATEAGRDAAYEEIERQLEARLVAAEAERDAARLECDAALQGRDAALERAEKVASAALRSVAEHDALVARLELTRGELHRMTEARDDAWAERDGLAARLGLVREEDDCAKRARADVRQMTEQHKRMTTDCATALELKSAIVDQARKELAEERAEVARLRAELKHPAVQRLHRVRPGTSIHGPGPMDMGYAVDLALDPKTHDTIAFGLAQTYRVGTTGTGKAEGPIRPVAEWAAEGWDVAGGGRA